MAKRKISSQVLAERIGITQANLSILKTGKAKAIRFSTLESICKALDCQPGDILEYKEWGIDLWRLDGPASTSSTVSKSYPRPKAGIVCPVRFCMLLYYSNKRDEGAIEIQKKAASGMGVWKKNITFALN